MTIQFPEYGERIWIKPESYGVDQRVAAEIVAREKGCGVRMEVHSSHTEFYADPDVAVGKVAVWAAPTYKGRLEYDKTLDSPDDSWTAEEYLDRWRGLG